jgi:hypothetical protein
MDSSIPTTSTNNNPTDATETQRPIIVKCKKIHKIPTKRVLARVPVGFQQSKFAIRSSLPSFRTINKKVAGKEPNKPSIRRIPLTRSSTKKSSEEIILLDDDSPVQEQPKIHPTFTVPSGIIAKRGVVDGAGEKIIVPQVISSGQITRLPIVVQQTRQEEGNSCARTRSFDTNRLGKNQKKTKKGRDQTIEFGLNVPTTSVDYHPKMAITSEPLLLYYQEQITSCKKQVPLVLLITGTV